MLSRKKNQAYQKDINQLELYEYENPALCFSTATTNTSQLKGKFKYSNTSSFTSQNKKMIEKSQLALTTQFPAQIPNIKQREVLRSRESLKQVLGSPQKKNKDRYQDRKDYELSTSSLLLPVSNVLKQIKSSNLNKMKLIDTQSHIQNAQSVAHFIKLGREVVKEQNKSQQQLNQTPIELEKQIDQINSSSTSFNFLKKNSFDDCEIIGESTSLAQIEEDNLFQNALIQHVMAKSNSKERSSSSHQASRKKKEQQQKEEGESLQQMKNIAYYSGATAQRVNNSCRNFNGRQGNNETYKELHKSDSCLLLNSSCTFVDSDLQKSLRNNEFQQYLQNHKNINNNIEGNYSSIDNFPLRSLRTSQNKCIQSQMLNSEYSRVAALIQKQVIIPDFQNNNDSFPKLNPTSRKRIQGIQKNQNGLNSSSSNKILEICPDQAFPKNLSQGVCGKQINIRQSKYVTFFKPATQQNLKYILPSASLNELHQNKHNSKSVYDEQNKTLNKLQVENHNSYHQFFSKDTPESLSQIQEERSKQFMRQLQKNKEDTLNLKPATNTSTRKVIFSIRHNDKSESNS